jgi:hypothetical protein
MHYYSCLSKDIWFSLLFVNKEDVCKDFFYWLLAEAIYLWKKYFLFEKTLFLNSDLWKDEIGLVILDSFKFSKCFIISFS